MNQAIDYYGDIITDDVYVVVIDCQPLKMVHGKATFRWVTYDVLITNLDSFVEEIDPSTYKIIEIMTGKEWREQE